MKRSSVIRTDFALSNEPALNHSFSFIYVPMLAVISSSIFQRLVFRLIHEALKEINHINVSKTSISRDSRVEIYSCVWDVTLLRAITEKFSFTDFVFEMCRKVKLDKTYTMTFEVVTII